MEQAFQGFNEDTYKFLLELAFQNNKPFFEANRARYKANVQAPMRAMAEDLLPLALSIDPGFNTRMTSILSRIHRDTRYSRDKRPYRDHAWLSFRRPGHRISESISLYFEITPQGYGYGLGMYGGDPSPWRPCASGRWQTLPAFWPWPGGPAWKNTTWRARSISGITCRRARIPP